MVLLGILIAIGAAAVGIGVISENPPSASLSVFGQSIPGVHTEGQVFAAGALVAVVFMLGTALSAVTMWRAMQVRRELRDLREGRQESLSTLEAERKRLERELARARGTGPATHPGVPRATSTPMPTDVPVAPRHARDRDPVSPFFDPS